MSRPKKPTAANHPLIAALFQELPTPGTEWKWDDRKKWNFAFQSVLDMIYSVTEPSINSPSFPPGVRGMVSGVGQPGPGMTNLSGPGRQFIDAGLSLSERSENEEEDI